MEFHIQTSEFLKGLRLAQNIADRKSTMPMLANVLLRTTNTSKLLLAATDLNVSVAADLSTSKTPTEGGITVNAKALHDIVSNLPGKEVKFKKTDNNWAEISAGRVKYRLVGLPDRDFPRIPDHREAEFSEIDSSGFRSMIDNTIFAICNDETRFHLNGVLFESDGKIARMVATDGHRLAKVERELDGTPKLSAGIIIPKKGVVELKRVLDSADSCKIAIKSPYVFLTTGQLTLAVKLIESQFPPYQAVIPEGHTRRLVIDRLRLLEGLKRAQLMSSETRGIKFDLREEGLLITSDNPDMGEVSEELEAEYTGEALSIGFNGKYMVEFLSHMKADQIALELNGELDPGVLQAEPDGSYLGVVMPMRI